MVQTIFINPNTGNLGIGTTSATTALQVTGIVTASTFAGVGQGFSSVELKTSGTTWTIPANVYKIKVTLIGGGGGGGGSGGTTTNATGSAGGGGGSGAVCIGFYNVTPGQTLTYAIGAAGAASTASKNSNGGNGGTTTTTYGGVTYTATGGNGGNGSSNNPSGGTGGTASGGTLNLSGQKGGAGVGSDSTNAQLIVCKGGDTLLGLGISGLPDRGSTEIDGTGYGAGGTGASTIGGGGQSLAGAAGLSGAVIIEY